MIFWYINWKNYSKPWLFLLRSPAHLLCKLSSTSCSKHMTTSISSQRFNHKIQGLWGLLHWSTLKTMINNWDASVCSMKTVNWNWNWIEIEIIKHCKVVEIRHSMLNKWGQFPRMKVREGFLHLLAHLNLWASSQKFTLLFRASISCSEIQNNFLIIGRYSPTIILSIILIYDSYVTVGNL